MRNLFLAISMTLTLTVQAIGAWHFDEVSQYVTVGDNAALTIQDNDWTIIAMLKLDDNTGTAHQYFYSWGASSANPSINLFITEASQSDPTVQNELRSSFGDNDTTVENSWSSNTDPFASNTNWTLVVYRRSGTNYSYFINGTSVLNATSATLNGIDVSGNLFLGARSDLDSARFYGGSMAYVGEWGRALRDDEIAGLAKGISPGCYPGFKLYMPMIRNYQELANGLTVTNNGSTVIDQPRLFLCD